MKKKKVKVIKRATLESVSMDKDGHFSIKTDKGIFKGEKAKLVKKLTLRIDEHRQVLNCYESAMYVRGQLEAGRACAIPLALGRGTLLNMSFVPLARAVPFLVGYYDGSDKGVQINIDRKSSYALPWRSSVNEWSYLKEKWDLGKVDGEAFLPFLNTILTGKNCYEKKQ